MSILDVPVCVWNDCEASASLDMKIPLCERHAIKAYRSVTEFMKTAPRRPNTGVAIDKSADRRRHVRTADGTIYFIRSGQRIKIGFTTHLHNRMRDLRPDEVLATQPGTMQDEQALHHRFGQYWLNGEWFSMGADLMAYIASIGRAA